MNSPRLTDPLGHLAQHYLTEHFFIGVSAAKTGVGGLSQCHLQVYVDQAPSIFGNRPKARHCRSLWRFSSRPSQGSSKRIDRAALNSWFEVSSTSFVDVGVYSKNRQMKLSNQSKPDKPVQAIIRERVFYIFNDVHYVFLSRRMVDKWKWHICCCSLSRLQRTRPFWAATLGPAAASATRQCPKKEPTMRSLCQLL